MSNYKPQIHTVYFAGFLFTNPEYKSLFYSWKQASELGMPNALELGEKLYKLMLENGYELN